MTAWFRLLSNDIALYVGDLAEEEVHEPEVFAARWRRWEETARWDEAFEVRLWEEPS